MALRESSKRTGEAANLGLIMGAGAGDGGVPHGAWLAALAEAVARWRWQDVAKLRVAGSERLGGAAVGDAIRVAAGFNGITRVADAIGIRLDAHTASASAALRAQTGIDEFAPPRKWR